MRDDGYAHETDQDLDGEVGRATSGILSLWIVRGRSDGRALWRGELVTQQSERRAQIPQRRLLIQRVRLKVPHVSSESTAERPFEVALQSGRIPDQGVGRARARLSARLHVVHMRVDARQPIPESHARHPHVHDTPVRATRSATADGMVVRSPKPLLAPIVDLRCILGQTCFPELFGCPARALTKAFLWGFA